jgi:hypothetical protein
MIEAQQQKLHHEASIIDTSGIAVEMILRQSSFVCCILNDAAEKLAHSLASNYLF